MGRRDRTYNIMMYALNLKLELELGISPDATPRHHRCRSLLVPWTRKGSPGRPTGQAPVTREIVDRRSASETSTEAYRHRSIAGSENRNNAGHNRNYRAILTMAGPSRRGPSLNP